MLIRELLDQYLLTEAEAKRVEKDKDRKLNIFYPSSAGQCVRKLWNEKVTPPEFPPEVYKKFLVGNLVHDFVQSKILKDFESEVPIKWFEGEIGFSGRIDSWDKKNGIIYEFKTISVLEYVRSKPKPEHVAQLNMYLHATGVSRGVIVYFTKNDVDVLEHWVDYSPELYLRTLKDFKKVYKYLLKNQEPKPNTCVTPWSCSYCKSDMTKKRAIIKAIKAKKLRKTGGESHPSP